ncbi:MAG: 50S ribosomal protein L24 [Candidatus Parcubacteria bacterium]|nr:MAG: 50S ribosomal protein L24 [Candidatus Parcubacteria bacterium]
MKIKKGDKVLIIKGKDRGKSGQVIKSLPRENKIIVEGLNLVKKHLRPKRSGEKGQIITIPHPIYVSKVKLICPVCKNPTRVGYEIKNNKKFRKCKKCNNTFA